MSDEKDTPSKASAPRKGRSSPKKTKAPDKASPRQPKTAGSEAKENRVSAANKSNARPQRRTTAMTETKKDAAQSAWDAMSHFDIFEKMSAPILVTDKALKVVFANQAAKTLCDADCQAIKGADLIGTDLTSLETTPALSPTGGTAQLEADGVAWDLAVSAIDGAETCVIEIDDNSLALKNRKEREVMEQEFDKLLDRMNMMSDDHEAGDIESMIQFDDFENPAFARAGRKVNEMVQAHIDTKKSVVKVFDAFGEGDFAADLPPLPGSKAFLNRSVNKNRDSFNQLLAEIRRMSNAISEGKLDITSNASQFKGSYRELLESFEGAFSSLNNAFGALSNQVGQVNQTVGQMRSASQELATNSQGASSSVDEVSASAEETDVQVKANAEAAKNASILVVANAEVAAEGKGKIDEMVTAMEGINASSQDIAKIIKVIDEIAFQTNLLALNAAVEAARAGQHGRGFAVVAQEVRNLAGRSAKAARETSDLIEGATSRVSAGVRLASETSESFEKIATNIEEVRELVETINRASEEQSRGVAQINVAISEVARTALATSQQADELASTTAEMTASTESMSKELGRYSLRAVPAGGALNSATLDNLSPEIMAKIQEVMGNAGAKVPAAALAAAGLGGSDHDERGFSNF